MSEKKEHTKAPMMKAAEKAAKGLLSKGMSRFDIDYLYVGAINRINEGKFDNCQICECSMPILATTEEQFLSTTCSKQCSQKLEAREKEKEEASRRLPQSGIGDLLPRNLQIKATLNRLQYNVDDQAVEVTIIAADIEEVEDRGVNAMVSISHPYLHIPTQVRIAAFNGAEQSAIIRSLIDEIPVSEAKTFLIRDAMAKTATLKPFTSREH